jgi:Protein of unknown function (DUF3096)
MRRGEDGWEPRLAIIRGLMALDIVAIQPLIALIAGILILIVPRILNYVVGIYLIIIGIMGLWPHIVFHTPH